MRVKGFTLVEMMIVAALIGLLAVIAIPNWVHARTTSQTNACLNNLRQIDAAKNEWALENRKKTGDVPTAQDLKPYLKNSVFPTCPAGGTYTIGAVGDDPTCSIPQHTLSQLPTGDVGNGSIVNKNAIEVAATPQTKQAPNTVGVFIPAPYVFPWARWDAISNANTARTGKFPLPIIGNWQACAVK